MIKNLFAGLLPAVFAALILISGCSGSAKDQSAITVWHWMVDRHEVFVELAKQYYEETGILVDFQLFAPSDIYSQKITAAAQARILPDIFGVLDVRSIFAKFIKNGFILNLNDSFNENNEEWKKSFFEKALAVNVFEESNHYGVEPGIYAVPLDVTTEMMVYNKAVLQDLGVQAPPATFEEFLTLAEKIRAEGITPLVSGWSELWLIDCFASNYAFNIMGQDKVMATFRGEVPYTDPDWIKLFGIFQLLAQKNIIDQGIVTKSNKFAEQDFALGRAAFAFNGSWGVNVYHDMNPNITYGVMPPPAISKEYPFLVWGGAGSSFVINRGTPNKDKAIAFLKWLTQKEQQQFLAEKTKNLPANRYALADLPSELYEFSKGMENSTHPTIWPAEEDLLVKEKFTKGLQSIIIGEKEPEEVAREVQEIKERQMQRAKNRR
ncbi:MAG: extracellular solute-binding protein [Candidatus Omnitrophota bacterium]